ncbi:MAG: DUF2779 domain-containing protein [Thermomonas sp.]|uniref:DUF2779 domain-containing protein n=1 Tax=Thermomonas sp. TaxID=1971895 RepID=UPI001ECA72A3|nr:DUF2779 domain-containing protein [Thermomonas sp.]MBV2209612.1 DUF2779 domain-containing protein [Thermomonas sp.]
MRTLSKSKLMCFRQCPKRLWLEVHRPDLRKDSSATQASFAVGHQVGDIAQRLYDPEGKGALIDPQAEGFDTAFTRTQTLLRSAQPIFEAGFRAEGALAFADVMLPVRKGGKRTWRMVEVKSSTSVKDYHRDDAAVQVFLAHACGVPLSAIALAHIDSSWCYPGDADYSGLLLENDLTEEAFSRGEEVRSWIAAAQQIVAKRKEPTVKTGKQCSDPYECGFLAYCQSLEPQAEQPIRWLPGRLSNSLSAHIEANSLTELRDVPDALLNDKQQRVKTATLSGKPYFDRKAAAQALASHKLPAYFMDFETIQFAVPIWKGTRPYQQIPFQFNVHRLSRTGKLEQQAFLDLSGNDPSKAFAKALIAACGKQGPIFVYNAGFETARIRELSDRFPRLAKPLLALNERVVDLLPVARDHYYHPSQKGSWSIKAVLPALCPDLKYGDLDGVQDGGMAMSAYLEAIAAHTSQSRTSEIEQQLLAYCALDTYAMVRLWSIFSGSALKV